MLCGKGNRRILATVVTSLRRDFMFKRKKPRTTIGLFTETIESNKPRDPKRNLKLALLGAIPILTLYLGCWQIRRLEWKENLIATIRSRIKEEAIVLNSQLLDSELPEEWEYRTFLARGEFIHDREMLVGPRSFEGQAGYAVFTPFRLDNGYIILVRRGWISKEMRDPRTRASSLLYDPVIIKGQLRRGERANAFTPTNLPESNRWYYANVQEMAQFTGSLPILLEAITDESQSKLSLLIAEGTPVPRPPEVPLPNNHAQYAFVWLSLAFLTTIMTIMLARSGGPRLPTANRHTLAKRNA